VVVDVKGASARDWEDMCSFRIGEQNYLLIADVGDNDASRERPRLHVLAEPRPPQRPHREAEALTARVRTTIEFTYEGGPRDCEAAAVDPVSRTILLAAKSLTGKTQIFQLPLSLKEGRQQAKAKPLAAVSLSLATGMDVSPQADRLVIGTYLLAYEFTRGPDESWSAALARPPARIPLPLRRQGESICYTHNASRLLLTSEGRQQVFWELRR